MCLCTLGEERRVLQLDTQVNAQQGDTFGVCKLLNVNVVNVNIASKELPSWLGRWPSGENACRVNITT